jgi:hypothetical protein
MKKKTKTEYYFEIHCEDCNEIIQTYFICPICEHEYAPTSIYGNIQDESDKNFQCLNCFSYFEYVNEGSCFIINNNNDITV